MFFSFCANLNFGNRSILQVRFWGCCSKLQENTTSPTGRYVADSAREKGDKISEIRVEKNTARIADTCNTSLLHPLGFADRGAFPTDHVFSHPASSHHLRIWLQLAQGRRTSLCFVN